MERGSEINSPRSLALCKKAGVNPKDLRVLSQNDFGEDETQSAHLYKAYVTRRSSLLRMLKELDAARKNESTGPLSPEERHQAVVLRAQQMQEARELAVLLQALNAETEQYHTNQMRHSAIHGKRVEKSIRRVQHEREVKLRRERLEKERLEKINSRKA